MLPDFNLYLVKRHSNLLNLPFSTAEFWKLHSFSGLALFCAGTLPFSVMEFFVGKVILEPQFKQRYSGGDG